MDVGYGSFIYGQTDFYLKNQLIFTGTTTIVIFIRVLLIRSSRREFISELSCVKLLCGYIVCLHVVALIMSS